VLPYTNIGEPTEAALRVLVEKIGTSDKQFNTQLDRLPLHARVSACNAFHENRMTKVSLQCCDWQG
jgi:Ca2+ transporting ATPase